MEYWLLGAETLAGKVTVGLAESSHSWPSLGCSKCATCQNLVEICWKIRPCKKEPRNRYTDWALSVVNVHVVTTVNTVHPESPHLRSDRPFWQRFSRASRPENYTAAITYLQFYIYHHHHHLFAQSTSNSHVQQCNIVEQDSNNIIL